MPDGRPGANAAPGAHPHVFRPGRIGRLELPHRIVMGSMHLGTEAAPNAADALGAFYAERARGGAGLMVTGGAAVSRVGAGGASYAILGEPSDAGLRAVPRAVHAAGGLIALQLFHAGRYAFQAAFGLQPVAPSAVASRFNRETPRALGDGEILATIDEFAAGARRAREWGYDAVEVMGSEGYLVDQFLSPLTNLRDDDWGGDAERRRRFGVALVRAIRAAVGDDFPIVFRFTGLDLMPGSTTPDEVDAFAAALAGAGADALNVGVGWHEAAVPTVQGAVPHGVWFPWAERIAAAIGPGVPIIAGNRVNRVATADRLLAGGAVGYVSMARPFLADPQVVAKARDGRPTNVCIACNQACIDRSISEGHVSCMVNPRAGFEAELPAEDERASVGVGARAAADARVSAAGARADAAHTRPGAADAGGGRERRRRGTQTVAVIGGGPAGLEAARALAASGVRVDLFEAEAELGGQFRYARLVPGKEDFGATLEYFAAELERLGVAVHRGRPLGDEHAALLAGFDGIVLATGVRPRRIALEGADLPHVVDYGAAFTDGVAGERVVILGAGGIGVDLAHRLTHVEADGDDSGPFRRRWGLDEPASETSTPEPAGGPQVTLLRRSGRIGAGMGRTTRWVSLDALRRAGVRTHTGVAYGRIGPDGVAVTLDDGSVELLAADTVVIAAGQEPNDALRGLVERSGRPHRIIGGAHDAAGLDAVRAFGDGLRAAYDLVAELTPDR